MTNGTYKQFSLMLKRVLQAAVLTLAGSALTHAAEPPAHPKVGMAVGVAYLLNAAGESVPLKSGQLLPPGSRIQTGADAVVVLVFPDNARLSLRADSELVLHQYVLDPSGHSTQMELELLRGAMRQISGTAAHAQPDRYRLKTPIAAIGVRGTDFLAQTQGQALETFINQGAIVVTPNPSICERTVSCDAIDLISGASQGAFLRLQRTGQVERKQLDLKQIEQLFGIGTLVSSTHKGKEHSTNSQVHTSSLYPTLRPAVFTSAPELAAEATSLPISLPNTLVPSSPSASLEPKVPESVPPVTQLVWGRFGSQTDLMQYQTLKPYAEASEGRHVRIGLLGEFALWRNNPNTNLQPGLSGRVDFRLSQAEAFLHQGDVATAASIDQARLSVDFDRSTFSTFIGVSHPQTGAQTISLSGRVNSEGVFNAVTTHAVERVAGALSRDGQEAGMLFAKQVPQGSLQGVTLWHK